MLEIEEPIVTIVSGNQNSPTRYKGHGNIIENRYKVVSAGKMKKVGAHGRQVTYMIKSVETDKSFQLVLQDTWAFEKELNLNDEICLFDTCKDENETFFVTREKGYLIINPDKLLTVTSIVGQSWCERKAVIQEFFKGPFVHVSALRGTIAHLFVTGAMIKKLSKKTELQALADELLKEPKIQQDAYGHGLSAVEFTTMVVDLIPHIQEFMSKHFLGRSGSQQWEIVNLKDIEDNYWSPILGIKGKVDATVEIRMKNNQVKIVPLEFKTGSTRNKGRSTIKSDHAGQLNLYTLMMRPRYGDIQEGILSYISEDGYNEMKVSLRDLQALVQARNRLERNTRLNDNKIFIQVRAEEDFKLKCTNCEMKTTCAVLLKNTTKTIPSHANFNETETNLLNSLSHLTTMDFKFWDTWCDIITMEAEEGSYHENLSKLWKLNPSTRCERGTCIKDLILLGDVVTPIRESGIITKYSITLCTKHESSDLIPNTFIAESEMVILSTDSEICIAIATVVSISPYTVQLITEDNIAHKNISRDTLFTIDKFTSASASKTMLSYLSMLMSDTKEAARLRQYIIAKKQPVFSKLSKELLNVLTPVVSNFNDNQMKVLAKALCTDSFVFVKGMPGTGKTLSIVGLIQILLHAKKTVLVVSYTHNALDNVLMRLKKTLYNDFIRIDSGRVGEPSLKSRLSSTLTSQQDSYQGLCDLFDTVAVVGTTLLSLSHPIFRRRRFDYCIIDEASQALLPSVFGALMVCDKYIFFGDQDQLPPVIKSAKVNHNGWKRNKAMKIQDNFFTWMATPMNTVKLTVQYRMNKVIMDVANKLVYKDQMSCSSREVANRCLGNGFSSHYIEGMDTSPKRSLAGVSKLINGGIEESVFFINTRAFQSKNLDSGDSKVGDSFENVFESRLVTGIVSTLMIANINPDVIGVIAPYRRQVQILRQQMRVIANFLNRAEVEVNTVDQYQGREKDIIICSFTKSNQKQPNVANPTEKHINNSAESILSDMRRLNVAVTRAKKKLILIGDSTTLREFLPFEKLFNIIPESEHVFIHPDDLTLFSHIYTESPMA